MPRPAPRSPINARFVPMSELPQRMWLSKNVNGNPGSTDSIQRPTLQISTASGFASTP